LFGSTVLGQASDSTFRFHFIGDMLEVTAQQLIFGGEPVVVKGSR
jgi:hypothetical protein